MYTDEPSSTGTTSSDVLRDASDASDNVGISSRHTTQLPANTDKAAFAAFEVTAEDDEGEEESEESALDVCNDCKIWRVVTTTPQRASSII
jgi:hypothetical protein